VGPRLGQRGLIFCYKTKVGVPKFLFVYLFKTKLFPKTIESRCNIVCPTINPTIKTEDSLGL
jgi:hypothetical protein